MLIAQISDCHIRDHASAFGKLVDTTETLGRVVDHLVDLDPGPDVVLATGDLTDDGTETQYNTLLAVLAPLADRLPPNVAEGHCSYIVVDHPVRLVGLDTSLPGRHDGRFDEVRESWLDCTLADEPDRPTVVFTHFPPFETGLRFMDQAGLLDADRFRATIERHPQVRLLVTGHLHRTIHTVIGSTPVSTCPSTGNQLGLDLHPDRGSAVDEPSGFQLHRWDGERFVTCLLYTSPSPRD